MSKLHIRRALEKTLKAVLDTHGVMIVMGGQTAPETAVEYVRTSISFGEDRPTEIGPTPTIQRSGKFHCGVFTEPRLLDDRNDVVCGYVREAFPYGANLSHEGIQVNITGVDDGQVITEGAYSYSPVYVKFMIWDTTNG